MNGRRQTADGRRPPAPALAVLGLLLSACCQPPALTAGEAPLAPRIDGEVLHADTLEFAGMTLRDVVARPRLADGVLTFADCRAKAYGGTVTGWYAIRIGSPGQPPEHRCHLELVDADLATLARANGTTSQDISGRIAGWFELNIPTDQPERMTGRGELRITAASLVQLPLLVSLLASDPLSGRDRDQVEARFEIRAGRIEVLWAKLTSPAADLTARGSIDFDGNLRLVVAPKLPFRLIDSVPVLGPVMAGGLSHLTSSVSRTLIRGQITRPVVIPALLGE
jgi:hypothetical protein